jgi:hypothetical protein
MLSTGLCTVSAGIALLLAVFAVFLSWKAVRIAVAGSAASVAVQKLTRIEADLTDTHELIDGLRESLHKMRSRAGMQRLRDERQVERDALPPDSLTDPAGYKRAIRAKLVTQGKLNGKFHSGS